LYFKLNFKQKIKVFKNLNKTKFFHNWLETYFSILLIELLNAIKRVSDKNNFIGNSCSNQFVKTPKIAFKIWNKFLKSLISWLKAYINYLNFQKIFSRCLTYSVVSFYWLISLQILWSDNTFNPKVKILNISQVALNKPSVIFLNPKSYN
jgi:hypothetical protein